MRETDGPSDVVDLICGEACGDVRGDSSVVEREASGEETRGLPGRDPAEEVDSELDLRMGDLGGRATGDLSERLDGVRCKPFWSNG
jgi:hypothetical protein